MTRYLLLVWRGKWTNDGPEHGRECLFDSSEEAERWIEKEYEGAKMVKHIIQPLNMPPAPWGSDNVEKRGYMRW